MDLPALLMEAMQLALWLALPVLAACVAVGALGAVLQAATHASDPALGFVPKLFAACGALWLSRDFLATRLVAFTVHVMQLMAQLGH